MSVSPFDHPFLAGLLGDEQVATLFSADADIKQMVEFESALGEAEAAEGLIPPAAGEAIAEGLVDFRPDMAALRAGTARDGVVVPELVRQMRAVVGEPYAQWVHFGATSQDAIDTSLALRLDRLLERFGGYLDELGSHLSVLQTTDGSKSVMAYTRMQAAITVPAKRRIDSWTMPIARADREIPDIRERVALLHLGGAAGTRDRLGEKGEVVARRMADALGLSLPKDVRHSSRDGIVSLADWLSRLTGALGKFGQDVALGVLTSDIRLKSGGSSSAMAHKVNPVRAEVLVALGRFNATLVSGMHQAQLHENERSGAAWTLEWMLLPQMTAATAAAIQQACELACEISFREP